MTIKWSFSFNSIVKLSLSNTVHFHGPQTMRYKVTVLYSKTCVKRPLSKRPQIGFAWPELSLYADQKYYKVNSAILSTFIKLPFVIKIFNCFVYFWVAVLHRFYCTDKLEKTTDHFVWMAFSCFKWVSTVLTFSLWLFTTAFTLKFKKKKKMASTDDFRTYRIYTEPHL